MTSTITLYNSCKILPNKAFIVDDISDYLGTFTEGTNKKTIANFQYIKHALNIDIKLDLSQIYLNPSSANDYNYISIQNGSDKIFYYFINSKMWKGQETILISLTCDTINTFKNNIDFAFDDKTKINRQHKDRLTRDHNTKKLSFSMSINMIVGASSTPFLTFQNNKLIGASNVAMDFESLDPLLSITNFSFDSDTGEATFKIHRAITITALHVNINFEITYKDNNMYRIIDLYSEGLTPKLYKKDKGTIEDDGEDWFLLWKTNASRTSTTDISPVNGYCLANTPLTITGAQSNATITADLNICYFFTFNTDGNITIETPTFKDGGTIYFAQKITLDGDNNYVARIGGKYDADIGGADGYIYFNIYSVSGDNLTQIKNIKIGKNSASFKVSPYKGYYRPTNNLFEATLLSTITSMSRIANASGNINGFASLDRADAQIIKLIKLPYAPFSHSLNIATSTLSMNDQNFSIADSMLKIKDNNILLNSLLTYKGFNPFEPLKGVLYSAGLTKTTLKSDIYESKLFHSDYYTPKFIYDSFGFSFKLETMSLESYKENVNAPLLIDYSVTSTCNSRFLFEFPQYKCDYEEQDYNNVLYVNRNNELPIYDSNYLDYVRSGYNYDVKSKNLSIGSNVALSALGTLALFSLPGGKIPAVIKGGASILGTAVSTITSALNAENSLGSKLANYEQQSASVTGSDDVDLMSKYTGNKAKLALYEVAPKIKKAFYDLFFYTGYIANKLEVPVVNTRIWFNFLQCEPVFSYVYNISDDLLEDLIDKFNNGVTYLHYNNISGVKTWDFEQQYENWETALNI